MKGQLEKVYTPAEIEDKIYELWEKSGSFAPRSQKGSKPYCVIMPPPNITGRLHMGHAIFVAIQDLFVRRARMQGREVLWLPGTDHASIATQNVVEKKLAKEGKTRHELGRDAFLEQVWEWVHEYGQIITTQIRKLGASCDWGRSRFTMDEQASKAVMTAFVELYDRKLIYKGKYLVNWCSRCQTVLADDEVEHEEEETKLVYIKYPLLDDSGQKQNAYIVVATVRPETILGDVAVAVHPSDPRYKAFVGRKVLLPVAQRSIPVIVDRRVDIKFGTGAVKITPAHDFNDYAVARENDLSLVNILNPDGTMGPDTFGYEGMNIGEARKKIINVLEEQGLVEKQVDYAHTVGTCYRCKTIIEPYLSTQWFVKTQPLAQRALQAVEDEEIEFVPTRFEKVFNKWLENFHDWCISRQLWWGHQIPAWYCLDCEQKAKSKDTEDIDHRSYTIVAVEPPSSCPRCGSGRLQRDPDVLDTWFSSALWPFSTLGWPEKTEDLKRFYPSDVMETGYDIIFFWVARMVILGMELMDDVPFRTVYLHGLVRDAQGRKMSKSLDNVTDPLDIIEEFGTDALRMSFLLNVTPGNDLKFSRDKVIGNRNFCNKIWNAARFVLMTLGSDEEQGKLTFQTDEKLPINMWIRSRWIQVSRQVNEQLDAYAFGEAGKLLYEFVWDEFCDWYLEFVKVALEKEEDKRQATKQVLVEVFAGILKLLHPYIPFITEEIWQRLHELAPEVCDSELLLNASWPEAREPNPAVKLEVHMQALQDVVQRVRNIRNELGLEQKTATSVYMVFPRSTALSRFFDSMQDYICLVAPLNELKIVSKKDQLPQDANLIEFSSNNVLVVMELKDDIDPAKRLLSIQEELQKIDTIINRTQELLCNEDFAAKAPRSIVAQEKEKLEDLRNKQIILEKQVDYYEKAGK